MLRCQTKCPPHEDDINLRGNRRHRASYYRAIRNSYRTITAGWAKEPAGSRMRPFNLDFRSRSAHGRLRMLQLAVVWHPRRWRRETFAMEMFSTGGIRKGSRRALRRNFRGGFRRKLGRPRNVLNVCGDMRDPHRGLSCRSGSHALENSF